MTDLNVKLLFDKQLMQ